MGILKKIIHIISYICYLLIGIYAVISIPMLAQYKPVVVLSGSMEPTFKTGSIIYYKAVQNENDININDIITYEFGQNVMVTHRVIDKDATYFYTKGDANNVGDSSGVLFSQIKGKVTLPSIPYLGYFVQYINNHYYLVIIVFIILLIEYILSNFTKDKKEEDKEQKETPKVSTKKEPTQKKVTTKQPEKNKTKTTTKKSTTTSKKSTNTTKTKK